MIIYKKYAEKGDFENMLGHTHMAVGIAAALAVFPPKDLPTLVVGVGAGAVGSLIPDIDVGTSTSHKRADFITIAAILISAVVILADLFFHVGIKDKLMQNENIAQVLIPAILFIAVCAYGKDTKHRTFMHSLVALIVLTACVAVALPTAAPFFVAGFASHILLDMLNKKRVHLLYPVKNRGICFNLCVSNGKANKVLFYVGSTVSVLLIMFHLWRIIVPQAQNALKNIFG